MVNQERGQGNLQQDEIDGGAGGNAGNQPAFAQLDHAEGKQDELLVVFPHRRQEGQSGEKDEPEDIHPVDRRSLGFGHEAFLIFR